MGGLKDVSLRGSPSNISDVRGQVEELFWEKRGAKQPLTSTPETSDFNIATSAIFQGPSDRTYPLSVSRKGDWGCVEVPRNPHPVRSLSVRV
ncbi:hypothetical protein TNIN_390801 [Trichonephila inaurata madagascariensis]|uniref:Uncharacterized protein n=1 Tax=Trichonephila inaurata madagascariensis TaxID=2747483 RepID=A0A8X6M9S1_9ARAC|nr:hypothetical protein TNIN_390801 [Trichonephila inaurata madagascariensis]